MEIMAGWSGVNHFTENFTFVENKKASEDELRVWGETQRVIAVFEGKINERIVTTIEICDI